MGRGRVSTRILKEGFRRCLSQVNPKGRQKDDGFRAVRWGGTRTPCFVLLKPAGAYESDCV